MSHVKVYQAERKRLKELRKREFHDSLRRNDENRLYAAASMNSDKFYRSKDWLNFRYDMLKLRGNRCEACGRGPKDGVVVQVDHIQPRYLFPELAFEVSNIQILCADCNAAKGVRDQTRWSTHKPVILRKRT